MREKYLTQTTLQREGSMKVRKKSWRKLTWRITNPFNFRVSFRDVREFLRKNFNCMTRPMKFLSSICHKFSKWDLKGERFNSYHLTRVRLRKNHESHGQDWYYMWDWACDQHTAWATGEPYEVLGYFEKGKSTDPSSAHTYETTPSITCPVTEENNLQFFNSRPRKVGFGGKNEIKRQEG